MSKKVFTALGLMSGTSMDGIDAAIITTDGHKLLQTGLGKTYPYSQTFRDKLRQLIAGDGDKNAITAELTHLHAKAAIELMASAKINKNQIDLIGFHGHTIDHRPVDGVTTQIGDGQLLSQLTGVNVVNDFRSNDVKHGGQGAPLVPIFHHALLMQQPKPVAVVNIGGVANVTWIGQNEGELLAFDTGPGNALLDDWMHVACGKNFDEGGVLAKTGIVDQELLKILLEDQYFTKKPPKSLDRNHFTGIKAAGKISPADGAAILVAFTAQTIALAARHFPAQANKWLIAGGGRHNAAIMDYLAMLLPQPVVNIDKLGIDGDMLEAQAFAFLAVRNVLGLPISYPGTTDVKTPMQGGLLHEYIPYKPNA